MQVWLLEVRYDFVYLEMIATRMLIVRLRGEPTESIDGNYHRNNYNHSILVEWHHMPLSKIYGVPTEGYLYH